MLFISTRDFILLHFCITTWLQQVLIEYLLPFELYVRPFLFVADICL